MKDVVIVSACRTAIGAFGETLRDMNAATIGSVSMKAAVNRAGIDPATGLNAAGNAPVVFSLDFGNMEEPALTLHRIDEVTAAVILGQGAEGNREGVVRESAAISDSPFNRIESVHNSNQSEDTAALESAGDTLLQDLQARETFLFGALQIPSTLYGRDYFVGDEVTARYNDIERNLKITAATIRVQEGVENITIEVSNVA